MVEDDQCAVEIHGILPDVLLPQMQAFRTTQTAPAVQQGDHHVADVVAQEDVGLAVGPRDAVPVPDEPDRVLGREELHRLGTATGRLATMVDVRALGLARRVGDVLEH
jgi:hypothetical protein